MIINVTAGRPAKDTMLNRSSPKLTYAAGALLALSLAAPALPQSSKPAFKPLDVFDLQWAADPQVSPDARNIAYVRMGFDIKTDRARGAVWLVGADGKNERPLSSAATSGSPLPIVEALSRDLENVYRPPIEMPFWSRLRTRTEPALAVESPADSSQ